MITSGPVKVHTLEGPGRFGGILREKDLFIPPDRQPSQNFLRDIGKNIRSIGEEVEYGEPEWEQVIRSCSGIIESKRRKQ